MSITIAGDNWLQTAHLCEQRVVLKVNAYPSYGNLHRLGVRSQVTTVDVALTSAVHKTIFVFGDFTCEIKMSQFLEQRFQLGVSFG